MACATCWCSCRTRIRNTWCVAALGVQSTTGDELFMRVASYAENLYMRDNEPSPPGYLLTVITFVQAIPNVVAAPPGLMYPDMPQMHWKQDLRN